MDVAMVGRGPTRQRMREVLFQETVGKSTNPEGGIKEFARAKKNPE